MQRSEGTVPVPGGKVWYEAVGEGSATPLIILHGGPGYPHDYLEPLEDLADERPVIFYDQLGCGNSERPDNDALWVVDRFVEELRSVVAGLGIKQYHLLGHSWGAALAAAHALEKPPGLKGVIFSNSYIGTPSWEKDAKRLIATLSDISQIAIARGDVHSPEYQRAAAEYYALYVNRMSEIPQKCEEASRKKSRHIYTYMWGPKEFDVRGTLKSFDLAPRLKEIQNKALLICGRHDEATPEAHAYFNTLLPNAEVAVLENSAHMSHWTERDEYIRTVRDFLKKTDVSN